MPVYTPSQPPIPNVFNYSPQYLKNWRKGLGGVRSGTRNSRVIFIGDSTTFGGNSAGAWVSPNITASLASLLSGSGLNAQDNSICGWSVGGATTGSRLGTDPRCTTGNWTAGTGVLTLGGGVLEGSSGSSSGTFIFAPTINVDTANVIWSSYATAAQATLKLGSGGTSQTLNYNQTAAIRTSTSTATLGANAVNITWNSGSTAYVEAVETYNSAKASVNLMNAGWWGSESSNWNDTSTNIRSINMLEYLAPDLTVIIAGINDWGNSVSVSTFQSNIQALITAAQLSGDVILMTPTPNATNTSIQPNYINALYQLAAANNCVLIDNYARWVSYATMNAVGFYSDTIHPTPQGYADQAQILKDVLLNI